MKRLGIAANRIAKGNFLVYNLSVIFLAVLFSAFIFIVAGATVLFALTLLRYLSEELKLISNQTDWSIILTVAFGCLTVITVLFTFLLLFYNIKLPKRKKKF